ncbi:MAG: hydroxymethylglutaryl-CoA lyase [Planctomycetota bacterium]
MSDRVRITDVAPRDGLQNEPGRVPTEGKAELVRALAATGAAEIEVSSFVSPKWIPQLGDAAELFGMLAQDKPESVQFSALVPNAKGMERLAEVNQNAGGKLIDKASVFAAASETFSQKNTNATIDETLERFEPVIEMARSHDLAVRGYISCVVACPYEGPIEPEPVATLAQRLVDLGCDEIDLGDTIGEGTPETIAEMLLAVIEQLGGRRENDRGEPLITLHLHDTFGRAADCVVEALNLGVRSFDGSAGGLGGCPFASTPGKRAPGNIATPLLVRIIENEGFKTGVNEAKMAHASAIAERLVAGARAMESAE